MPTTDTNPSGIEPRTTEQKSFLAEKMATRMHATFKGQRIGFVDVLDIMAGAVLGILLMGVKRPEDVTAATNHFTTQLQAAARVAEGRMADAQRPTRVQ